MMLRSQIIAAGLMIAAGCGGDDDAATADAPPAPADAVGTRPLVLADLLAPVTDDERARVTAEWEARDHGAHDVEELATGPITIGTVAMTYRILAHTIDGTRHVGAVLVPDALTGPAPVLVYAHGAYTGEGGLPPVDLADLGFHIPGQPLREQLIYVVPAYRGERISADGTVYTADGIGLIGTTDISDAAALLTVVGDTTPLADLDRVAVLGESRGGTVALGFGARDPRVDLVVDAFGPTDFRLALAAVDESTFAAVIAAAAANPDEPANLLTRSLVPLDAVTVGGDGALTITEPGYLEMRRRMAATSAVATPLDLPATQVHHGTADSTATVEYSRALAAAMAAAGRPSPSDEFTYHEYDGGDHDLATLPGAFGHIAEAIERELLP
jgi:acetyl esterase/lipase